MFVNVSPQDPYSTIQVHLSIVSGLPDPRRSLITHPDAISSSRFSRDSVFQQPRLFTTVGNYQAGFGVFISMGQLLRSGLGPPFRFCARKRSNLIPPQKLAHPFVRGNFQMQICAPDFWIVKCLGRAGDFCKVTAEGLFMPRFDILAILAEQSRPISCKRIAELTGRRGWYRRSFQADLATRLRRLYRWVC